MTLRNAFENLAVESKQDAGNEALATIRDSVFRRTDSIAAGVNLIGNVGSIIGTQVGLGRFFVTGTGRLALTGVTGGNMRSTLLNPVGSGKNVVVVAMTCFATTQGFASLFLNPTQGLPATAVRPHLNAIAGGGLAPVAQFRSDTSAMTALSGGQDTGIAIGLSAGDDQRIDLPPLILSPGVMLGISIPFGVPTDVAVNFFFYETTA